MDKNIFSSNTHIINYSVPSSRDAALQREATVGFSISGFDSPPSTE